MTEVVQWQSPIGASIYSMELDGQTIFSATHVVRGLSRSSVTYALAALDEDEVVDHEAFVERTMIHRWVTEPGLYRLAATAKTPQARKFQRWIFHDVLPSIRRTGAFMDGAVQAHLEVTIGQLQARIQELESAPKALPSRNEIKKPKARCPQGHNTWGKDQYGGAFWYCSACHHAGNTPFRIFFDK